MACSHQQSDTEGWASPYFKPSHQLPKANPGQHASYDVQEREPVRKRLPLQSFFELLQCLSCGAKGLIKANLVRRDGATDKACVDGLVHHEDGVDIDLLFRHQPLWEGWGETMLVGVVEEPGRWGYRQASGEHPAKISQRRTTCRIFSALVTNPIPCRDRK